MGNKDVHGPVAARRCLNKQCDELLLNLKASNECSNLFFVLCSVRTGGLPLLLIRVFAPFGQGLIFAAVFRILHNTASWWWGVPLVGRYLPSTGLYTLVVVSKCVA